MARPLCACSTYISGSLLPSRRVAALDEMARSDTRFGGPRGYAARPKCQRTVEISKPGRPGEKSVPGPSELSGMDSTLWMLSRMDADPGPSDRTPTAHRPHTDPHQTGPHRTTPP